MLKTVRCTDSFLVWEKKIANTKWEDKIDGFVLYAKQNDEIFKFIHEFYELSLRNDLWESGTQPQDDEN